MQWVEAHRVAMLAAVHAHRDLGIEASQRVDVFDAIERANVLLAFEPFPRLAGMYFAPPEFAPAIVVNALHPLARQRYTAAHEFGHHYLDHGTSIDPEIDPLHRWGSRAFPDTEKVAEAFASWFLMPEALVRKELAELGISGPQSPADVYALSLRLGTSYRATARHLQNLRLAPRSAVENWVEIPPRSIKESISGNMPPANWHNDVWLLDESDHDHSFDVRVGDRLIVSLPETPSSGFTWMIVNTPTGIELMADSFETPVDLPDTEEGPGDHAELVGAESRRVFVFDALANGNARHEPLVVAQSRPWDSSAEEERRFEAVVRVETPRRGVPEHKLVLAA